ncbi:hypothetical protein LAV77_02270 [Priestia megaterium]|uniref:AbiJ-NTD4 domain-containing protein n=1 Tax=Priestia megaterium TaxID=1404 RepID=UPI002B248E3A|nr:hypothetical protein [Priestia megaterium]MEB2263610.1 hypothetical protein [Priestia megaterium]
MKFSERMGIKPARSVIQLDSMDDDLKNSLWNVLYEHVFSELPMTFGEDGMIFSFFRGMYRNYFKKPVDRIERYNSTSTLVGEIKDYYCGGMLSDGYVWYEVYDFVEYVAQHFPFKNGSFRNFKEACNYMLERELSGYRFVDTYLVPVTDEIEIEAIETVLESENKIDYAKKHIECALGFIADKQAPDYRNSIKESISAVEAIGNTVLGKSSSSLGEVLKLLEKQTDINLHPALKNAFMKLYGYTSDASGIRHALTDDSTVSYEDAKYMLVACSAFVNYLVEKAIKADIPLN